MYTVPVQAGEVTGRQSKPSWVTAADPASFPSVNDTRLHCPAVTATPLCPQSARQVSPDSA